MNPYENMDCMLNDLYKEERKPLLPFIISTAKDYDMEYEQVKHIWDKWGDNSIVFYEKLEDFIKERANR